MSADVSQAVSQVRQVTHWPATFTASGSPSEGGRYTIQLILDEGASEQILAVNEGDADNLFDWLSASEQVFYDLDRGVLMFGTRATGS